MEGQNGRGLGHWVKSTLGWVIMVMDIRVLLNSRIIADNDISLLAGTYYCVVNCCLLVMIVLPYK